MFKNKPVFLTTGPSVFSNDIKQMVQNFFGAIPVYVNNDKPEDLEYFAEQGDALILAGGSDVFRGTLGQPIVHGEGLSKFDILRDKREINLIESFVQKGKPILGICRGLQLICAHYGFYLMADIGSQITHSLGDIKINLENGEFAHYIECLSKHEDDYFKGKIGVNSYHHQGIFAGKTNTSVKSRNGIDIIAVSDTSLNNDNNYKIVEIIESKERNILACQFHPEADWMYGNPASLMVLKKFKQLIQG